MFDRKKLGALKGLMSRIDQAYEAADAALADPKVSDTEKREKVHAFLDAGSHLTDLRSDTEIH